MLNLLPETTSGALLFAKMEVLTSEGKIPGKNVPFLSFFVDFRREEKA